MRGYMGWLGEGKGKGNWCNYMIIWKNKRNYFFKDSVSRLYMWLTLYCTNLIGLLSKAEVNWRSWNTLHINETTPGEGDSQTGLAFLWLLAAVTNDLTPVLALFSTFEPILLGAYMIMKSHASIAMTHRLQGAPVEATSMVLRHQKKGWH